MTESRLDEIAPTVFQFPCLSEAEADEIHARLRRAATWEPAPIRKRAPNTTRLREDLRVSWEIREHAAPDLFSHFERTVRARAAALATELAIGAFEVSEIRALRYDEGGFFKVHTDTTGQDGRRFAIVIYLNDDFEGGATVFPLLGCRSTPKKGKGLVFPTDRLHRGDVVTSGTKYILVLWLMTPMAA